MATDDDSGIGGRKTRIRGDSSKDVELEKGKSYFRLEANKKKKKDK